MQLVSATLAGTANYVILNLENVVSAEPVPQVRGGPNTLNMVDGTTFVINETINDLAGMPAIGTPGP